MTRSLKCFCLCAFPWIVAGASRPTGAEVCPTTAPTQPLAAPVLPAANAAATPAAETGAQPAPAPPLDPTVPDFATIPPVVPNAAQSFAVLEPAVSPPPDAETLRLMIAADLGTLGSLSIGTPDAGALLGGQQMPEGPLWHIRNPAETWGTEETLAFLEGAIETVAARYPGSPRLLIGDISAPDGGRLNRHRSHQAGRDVDVGWYFLDGEADTLRDGRTTALDLDRSWALIRALVTQTDVERIFMDRSIQRRLYRHALASGEDPDWLAEIFQCVRGRNRPIVQHERRHRTHFHVRFYNRRAQEWGRAAYRPLAEAGLVPPPVIMHRARSGETLSGLAHRYGTRVSAIRRANGLRSTLIRAGRRYRIPVRLAAGAVQPPVVVPPRCLPPAPPAVTTTTDDGPAISPPQPPLPAETATGS
jgi:penicillin-insensitive murein endopeptidase